MTRRHVGASPASPKATNILLAIITALVALQPTTPVRAAVGLSPTADDTWGTEIAATGKAGRVLAVAVRRGPVYLRRGFPRPSPPGPNDPSALAPPDPPA